MQLVFWTNAGRAIRRRWRRIIANDEAHGAGMPSMRRRERLATRAADGAMSYAQYRCLVHGNWVNSDNYRKCPICGEHCQLVQENDRDDAFDMKQSSAKKAKLLAEVAAEANAAAEAARQEEAALEQRISDSEDVLRWDLDHWTEVDLSDWGPARELGG